MRVLFRVAAGPRLGFGHLVRCQSLARALGVDPVVSVRGAAAARRMAGARGFELRPGGIANLCDAARPDVLIVDDPSPQHAEPWARRAGELGIPAVTVHDLGLGHVASDLQIDGSIEPGADRSVSGLSGPMYAVLDPSIAAARARAAAHRQGVLIALGGGDHVHEWGSGVAAAILQCLPNQQIRIVEGFSRRARPQRDPRVTWVSAPDGLAEELRTAAVAVVAGGLTLYEAAALATPIVALAVVEAQQPTIRGFARRGAALDAGIVSDPAASAHAAGAVVHLIAQPTRAARLGATAAHLVDGRGVFRVADAIEQLARRFEERVDAA